MTALNTLYTTMDSPSQLTSWVSQKGDPCGQSWLGITCSNSRVITMWGDSSEVDTPILASPWLVNFLVVLTCLFACSKLWQKITRYGAQGNFRIQHEYPNCIGWAVSEIFFINLHGILYPHLPPLFWSIFIYLFLPLQWYEQQQFRRGWYPI